MSRNTVELTRQLREELSEKVRTGVLVPVRREGHTVLLSREEAQESHEVALDLLAAHGARVEKRDADGRVKVLERPKIKGKAWRAELLQDAAAADTPERLGAFRRKWALGVRKADLERLRGVMRLTRVFTEPDLSRISPQLLARYDERTMTWAGMEPLYVTLIYELRVRDRRSASVPRGATGASAGRPLELICHFCRRRFSPRGSVMDACEKKCCRTQRRNMARREQYANTHEVRQREKQRVYRWRRRQLALRVKQKRTQ